MASSKMKVITSDEQEFEIGFDIAKQSKLLKLHFDDDIDEPVRLPHIQASIFKAIIDFCNHHKNDPEEELNDNDDDDDDDDSGHNSKNHTPEVKRTTVINEWDRKFVQQFTIREEKLFDIITAASYLGINSLTYVFCRTYIPMTRGKTTEEIQELFKSIDPVDGTVTSQTITKKK